MSSVLLLPNTREHSSQIARVQKSPMPVPFSDPFPQVILTGKKTRQA